MAELRKLTLKQRKLIVKTVELGNQTQAAMESYNVKNRKNASKVAQHELKKPHVKQAYLDLLHKAGLTDKSLAARWAETLNDGKGVKATHKDYLYALTTITKMKGWLNPKTGGLKISLTERVKDIQYDELAKGYQGNEVLEGELVG